MTVAANDTHDFLLGPQGGQLNGYMLVRSKSMAARAWKRYGVNVSPAGSSPDEGRFNAGPAEIRFAETFDDFSGGFGYAYRTAAPANGIHWSENMDTRFSGQAVHCQALLSATLYDDIDTTQDGGVQWFYDIPLKTPKPETGFGAVFAYGRRQNLVGNRDSWRLAPKSNLFPAAMDATAMTTTTGNGLDGPPAVFGSYLYVGGASGMFTRFDLDGSNGTLGPVPARGFVNAGNRLWMKLGAANKRSTWVQSIAAGGATFNWGMTIGDYSATLMVGNGQRSIADMVAFGDKVFLGLQDGIYQGDQSGSFINVTGELAQLDNLDNFRDLVVHNGQVVGQHITGLYAYDPTNTSRARVQQIGPAARSNKSPVQGYDTALESFGGWLYAARWTGSQSYLMAGREMPEGYRWNLLNRLPLPGRVSRLHVDGITYGSGGAPAVAIPNRLWAAMDGSFGDMLPGSGTAAPLYFQPIPRLNANPLAPDPVFSANYCGSARMVLPRSDRGAPGVLKMYEYAEMTADAFLSGSRYADVYYAIDGGPRTLLGRAQTSPVSRLYFTQSNPSFYSGRSLEWDVESYNTTPGTCQVYRSIVGYGVMRPVVAGVIEAVVHVGDNVPDRKGTPMRPGRVMSAELHSYEDPAQLGGQILTLIDLAGATQTVVVVPPIGEAEFYQDGRGDPEIQMSVKMAVLTYSGG
jgi:hypothetical protein